MKKAELYKKLKDRSVQCLACSWYCRIPQGQVGICSVRENINGDLYLLVYGKASSVAIDPIEKKPLFHFLPGTKIFSLGTLGCNFACQFCQNWEISQGVKSQKLKVKSLRQWINDNSVDLSPKRIVEETRKHHLPSMAFTYNEPAIFVEYALETMKLAKKKGLKTVFVSSGYESQEAIKAIAPYLDAINIDLKSFRERFYLTICKAKLQPVLENIKRFHKLGVWVEVTTLVIPGENDSEAELKDIARFLVSLSPAVPWHISRFHPDYKMLDYPPTPIETLKKAYEIGKKIGLKYVYLGNVLDEKHESTYCPKCKKILIRRAGYQVEIFGLEKGKCKFCGEKIEGVWS